MRTVNMTWVARLISMGGTIALVAALAPQVPRAEQSGENSTEKPTLEVIGEFTGDAARLSPQEIIAATQAAGFNEVLRIEWEKGLYEVQVRHPRRGSSTVLEVYVDAETGQLLLDPETGEPSSKRIGRSEDPIPPVPYEQIVEQVLAEGYVEVYSIQYRHSLFEVKVRDSEGARVELFAHATSGKLLRNRNGKLLSQDLEP